MPRHCTAATPGVPCAYCWPGWPCPCGSGSHNRFSGRGSSKSAQPQAAGEQSIPSSLIALTYLLTYLVCRVPHLSSVEVALDPNKDFNHCQDSSLCFLPVCPSVSLSVFSLYLSVCLLVCPSVIIVCLLSVCLSVCSYLLRSVGACVWPWLPERVVVVAIPCVLITPCPDPPSERPTNEPRWKPGPSSPRGRHRS
jgi:hypothetical protein